MVFGKRWFKEHQGKLLWLLNAPFIGRWFRWKLRIRSQDLEWGQRITAIRPNSFSYGDRWIWDNGTWNLVRETDFRTNNKFAQRLYFGFKPLWMAMHVWDLVADAFVPQLSFGFSTLTAYPDPGPTEVATVDGRAYTTGQITWTLARDAATGDGAGDNEGGTGISAAEAKSVNAANFEIIRSFFLFDTSAINDAETVTAAVFSFVSNSVTNGDSGTLRLVTSTPASNTAIVAADFDQLGTVAQASDLAYGSITADSSTYNAMALNATGRGNVAKTGISKFGLREGAHDADNVAVANGTTNDCGVFMAEAAGTTTDPKLVVTSSLARKRRFSVS